MSFLDIAITGSQKIRLLSYDERVIEKVAVKFIYLFFFSAASHKIAESCRCLKKLNQGNFNRQSKNVFFTYLTPACEELCYEHVALILDLISHWTSLGFFQPRTKSRRSILFDRKEDSDLFDVIKPFNYLLVSFSLSSNYSNSRLLSFLSFNNFVYPKFISVTTV